MTYSKTWCVGKMGADSWKRSSKLTTRNIIARLLKQCGTDKLVENESYWPIYILYKHHLWDKKQHDAHR